MNKPILYIHAGINKTGTTSIQYFLAKNYDAFLSDSILYPLTGRDEMLQHHFLFSSIRIPEHPYFLPKKRFVDYVNDLEEEIQLHNPKKVILSSEIFCDLSCQETDVLKEKLNLLFGLFSEVKVLFYLRRPDKYGISNNNTMIWYGRRQHHQLIYPNMLEWARFLEKDQLIFRPFEKCQFVGGDIFSDFMSAVSIDFKVNLVYPPKDLNESYEDDIIELMRIINNSHHEITKNNKFKYLLLAAFPKKGKAKNAFFSAQDRLDIINQYEGDIQTIARDYLGREDGRLFYDPLPEPNEPWEPYKGLSVETVVQAFSHLIYKHQEQITEQEYIIHSLSEKQGELKTTIEFQNQRLNDVENQLKEIKEKIFAKKSFFHFLNFTKK